MMSTDGRLRVSTVTGLQGFLVCSSPCPRLQRALATFRRFGSLHSVCKAANVRAAGQFSVEPDRSPRFFFSIAFVILACPPLKSVEVEAWDSSKCIARSMNLRLARCLQIHDACHYVTANARGLNLTRPRRKKGETLSAEELLCRSHRSCRAEWWKLR